MVKNYLFWLQITHYLPKFGFISSAISGGILLFLNYAGAQKQFGSYKYIISSFTVLGIVFAAVESAVSPNFHNFNAGYLYFSFERPFGIENMSLNNAILASYTFFYAATIALLAVQFIYRYWAVFDTNKLQYFTGYYWLIWIFFCCWLGFQFYIGVLVFLAMDPISTEYLREEIWEKYHFNISEFPTFSLVAYDPETGSPRWFNLMGLVNIFIINNFQYSIMVYCGWAMHTQMEDKIKNLSESLRKHHKQFFKTLVIQITAPTIMMFIPVSIINFTPIFNLTFSLPSGVLLCWLTVYPAMNSLIVMIIVTEYRRTAKKLCKKVWNRVRGIQAGSGNYKFSITASTVYSEQPPSFHQHHRHHRGSRVSQI